MEMTLATKPRILVVEDEQVVAAALRKRLQALGYEVPATVSSGEEAVEKAVEIRPDLILMDIQLEGRMDGIEAAALIRGRCGTPVVFLTAYSNQEILDRAKATEPFGYVLKPYEERELQVVVEMALYKHRAEAQLRESEQRFRQLVENIHQVFWQVDADGKVLYVSPSYERVWGRTCASLFAVPRSFLDAIHPEDRKKVSEALERKFETGGYEEEYRITQPDGCVRWIRDRGYPVRDERGRIGGFVGIAEDITAQQQLEEKLQQAQKMAAVSRLAGGVAHAFNNLMTTVLGYSDIMLAGMKPSDAYFASAQAIKRSATRAATLTQQLLAFGRKQILILRPVDLNAVVSRLERVVQNMQSGVRLGLSLEPGLRLAKTDPDQLEEAILILVRNACEAMPHGGQLTIQTANVELGRDYTADHLEIRSGPYVLLAVSDTGVGMNEEAISHLFEPFNTKEADVGAGLGLAAVFGLVKQCGGDIEVRSEPGTGTTFRLYLPMEGGGSEEGEPPA